MKQNYYNNARTLYDITVPIVQTIVMGNLDRLLTEKELGRMFITLIETEHFHLDDFIMEAVENAIDNSNGRWDEHDKQEESDKDYVSYYRNKHAGENDYMTEEDFGIIK